MTSTPADSALVARVRDHYDAYYSALDDVRLEEWPGFFTEECLYRVIPRENFERGYKLCTMWAESRAMLQDRVMALRKTQMYAPRYYRRFPGPLRVMQSAEAIHTRHNLLVVQTLVDRQSEIAICGVCHDVITEEEGRLLFRERIVVIDTEMIANSFIFPA